MTTMEQNVLEQAMKQAIEQTKTRFTPYFNTNTMEISFNQKSPSPLINITIKINLIADQFKAELEAKLAELKAELKAKLAELKADAKLKAELKAKLAEYSDVDVVNIIEQINILKPTLTGFINLTDKEAHISVVKVGLFTSSHGDFTRIQRDLIKNVLGGKGIAALLVLMFIYVCYSFNHKINPSNKIEDNPIENISLDDSSEYPGWYKQLLFEYPDEDEVANLDLTPNIFEKLQKIIFQYSTKSDGKEIHILNKMKLIHIF